MGAEAVLELRGISKRFGSVVAVDEVSLEVAEGELVALVGPSGCGKSTLLRLVAGLEHPDRGEILVRGDRVAGPRAWRPPERRRVGIVFQDHALFPHLTVAANVAFGLDGWPAARRRARVDEVLDLVAMSGYADRYPHELSGGEGQRVALARALAPQPAVLLLDEPFSNLDRNLRVQIREDTTAILERAGVTVLFVTHDQQEALAVGRRVAVMRDGRVEQADLPDRVFHAPTNRFVATFMGDADFLPARLDRRELVTEAGRLPAPPGLGGAAGEAGMEVMARPHEVAIDPDGRDARVVAAEFQGAFVLYRVALASGRIVRSLQPHTAVYPVGTRVAVTLQHGHTPTVMVGDDAVSAAGLAP
ncbi:MAG: ATP-binding cassette domain-containing protein [Streptosporangiales bacterium]|nr:ATP-binding cassette domain-containing protein [Streptosporangiales bacterium]